MLRSTTPHISAHRRGAVLVETALIIIVFFMFVFGIYEYGRYLMVLHVTNNAARDAARNASVRASTPIANTFTFPHPTAALPFENATDVSRMYQVPFIETYLNQQMAGVNNMIANYTVRVFPTDSTLMYSDPPVIRPKTGATGWNNAAFSERIAVRVVGYYDPITPNLLFTNRINFTVTALIGSEG
jgi:Flp pilus assembly protein TadG